MPKTDQTLSDCPNHETSIVWDEAGFIPPVFYRTMIEFLHRLNSDDIENIYSVNVTSNHTCETGEKISSGCSEYIFTNRERMYRFAEDMNIPAGNMTDTDIADEILRRLIDEYTTGNSILPKRSGIMEVLYKISTCIA